MPSGLKIYFSKNNRYYGVKSIDSSNHRKIKYCFFFFQFESWSRIIKKSFRSFKFGANSNSVNYGSGFRGKQWWFLFHANVLPYPIFPSIFPVSAFVGTTTTMAGQFSKSDYGPARAASYHPTMWEGNWMPSPYLEVQSVQAVPNTLARNNGV